MLTLIGLCLLKRVSASFHRDAMFELGHLESEESLINCKSQYKEYEQEATTTVVTLQKGPMQKVLWIVFHVTIGITKSTAQIVQLE